MGLVLSERYIEEMVAHAREEAPNECCGVIAGQKGWPTKLFRVPNTAASPYRYLGDPWVLRRVWRECIGRGWGLLAIYHSHPTSAAYPSPADARLAVWPSVFYVVVSLQRPESPEVCVFRIEGGRVKEG
ncbi:MAG: M67 family metallopeptidase [Chloroflexota bacterium]|nr:M67 family metallopeptidase [Chloroflexota bacterium]